MAKKKAEDGQLTEVVAEKSGTIRSDVRIASFDWVESLFFGIVVLGVIFNIVLRKVKVCG